MITAADQVGTDIDFFVLPPIDSSETTPAIGTADFMSALTDRPEVRAFMRLRRQPRVGQRHWAASGADSFYSPNQRFDLSNYGDASQDPAAGVKQKVAAAMQSALQSDAFRIDASDLMPDEIGGYTEGGGPGAFDQGMIDWVDGTRTIEQVFADIDAAWAALDDAESDPGP